MKKILVIAPHADDEVLGVGGYLLHQAKEGAEIFIAFGAIGGINKRQVYEERIAEYNKVRQHLNVKDEFIFFKGMDAQIDTIPSLEIAKKMDYVLEKVKPDEVFLNYSSHHQDHKKLYDCAFVAFRLKEGFNPKLIALYEYPFISTQYDYINGGRWYHDITDVIEDKVKMFYYYKSQVRKQPSPLNKNGIKSLAVMRGMESGCKYAEMFYIQKLVK